MKTLIFAEKPSVGRDIAKLLKAGRQGKGYLEGDSHVVTWGIGHLVAIGHPEVQNPSWKRWALDSLPMIPKEWKLVVLDGTGDQFKIVEGLMSREDIGEVVNAADAGREGELIFRLVYSHAGCKKPVKRLWISSMTDEAILAGFKSLKPGAEYDPLGNAALCRSRADWLVGINLTRCYTKKFDEKYTVGRVQTPTLAMVVKRHKEILDFKPVTYWEVVAKLTDFRAVWFEPGEKEYPTRIKSLEGAQKIIESLKSQTAVIEKVTKTRKKQPPPFLYDLTTLQREANARFGFTAAHTLEVAQSLYEKRKAITYPRTDSRFLSQDIHKTLPAVLNSLPPQYEEFSQPLKAKLVPRTKRVFDDSKVSDHHAIIPTVQKNNRMDTWTHDERQIYDLVAKRFLAVFYPDYEYQATVIIAVANGQNLKASGSVPLITGWKQIYGMKDPAESEEDKQDDSDEKQHLPDVKKSDRREITEAVTREKKTRPPQAYTEATILQAMETAGRQIEDEELRDAMKDGGLGTPATRADIIEKLIKVGYLLREAKKLIPTPKGIHLIGLASGKLISPELTGQWEKRLALISKKKDDPDVFMKDISDFVSHEVAGVKVKTSSGKVFNSRPKPTPSKAVETQKQIRPSFGKCPACGKGNIIEGKRGFGCDRFREGCNYVVWREFYGKKITQAAVDALIAGRPTRLIKGFVTESGEKVSGKLRMREDGKGIELVIMNSSSRTDQD